MSPRSTLHSPVSYRTSGVLLVLSGVAVLVGQLIGLLRWKGMYSLTENRSSDLAASTCGVLRDTSGVRFVCNPQHTVTAATVIASGLLVVCAAVLMAVAARRDGDQGVIGTASLLGVAGLATVVSGVIPVDVHGLGHDIALLLYLIAMWAAMEVLVDSATRHAETTGDAHPLIYGAYVPITRVMEFFSIVGALTLIFSGRDVMPGAFERVALDVLTVWIVVFGLGLISLGGAADRERMRVAAMERQHWAIKAGPSSAATAGFGREVDE
ncbi:DUF998 domain-containing protein [Corynebacterium terpenotabidum]|uniref:DUF998 domain-containing protein n=1 Tax=Corynebacterium terpenotabidum Y-11 TaxID=1200352 RepID=S4XEG6_9CORY|nr:DUF998 domain-containing protein [Corynebacterium terpenotabidum]AGP31537.1 hypothetical protein A606_09490 [Corynebacterium terpenotabidum Y-11]